MVVEICPLELKEASVVKRGKLLVGPISRQFGNLPATLIMGANGSGKTTLLRAINGLERLSSGKISWACDWGKAKDRQTFVFQTPILLRRTVLENLIYPLVIKEGRTRALNEKGMAWLERLGLFGLKHQDASRLSGGEKQKLALARALITEPALLLLDEPTSNLDGRATREIETLLKEICANGTRIIMSTHDIGQAKRLADEVVFLHGGKIVEDADAKSFFMSPSSAQARAFLEGDIVE